MGFLVSTRLRRWLFAVLVVPLVGRLLESAGGRMSPSRPRAGQALTGAGRTLRRGRSRG